jgi:hypothetical protein
MWWSEVGRMPTGRDILFNPEHRTSDIKMVNGKNKETDVQYSRHKHWLFHSTLNVHLYKPAPQVRYTIIAICIFV